MEHIVKKAIELWGLTDAKVSLIACRENQVYRVDKLDGETIALRIHRKGYRTLAELSAELQWVAFLFKNGLPVALPIPSIRRQLVEIIEGYYVDTMTWLDGIEMGKAMLTQDLESQKETFLLLGKSMAKMHHISDTWQLPKGFKRHSWNIKNLIGDTPIWGEFWENPKLTNEQRLLLLQVRTCLQKDLSIVEDQLDFGLIHADLVKENVLLSNGNIQLIDFDDAGFGFRLFDLATALLKHQKDPNYSLLKDAFLEGYQTVRSLDLQYLDTFILLRALTYVGWIIPRLTEANATERCNRYIEVSIGLALNYFDKNGIQI